jgi:hypothetical protein
MSLKRVANDRFSAVNSLRPLSGSGPSAVRFASRNRSYQIGLDIVGGTRCRISRLTVGRDGAADNS